MIPDEERVSEQSPTQQTGERTVWRGSLPAGAKATPMTFRGPRDGRQYVVVAAGGDGELWGWSDAIVAFRLKR